MTWDRFLEDFAAAVGAAQTLAAVVDGDAGHDDGSHLPVVRTWSPPSRPPSDPPTDAEQERFVELRARADACRDRLETAMARTVQDLDTVRRRRAAARRYGHSNTRSAHPGAVPTGPG